MASTKIPVELSSTPGIVDNSNATAITIDSNENVGVGVTSIPSWANLMTDGTVAVGGTLYMKTGNPIQALSNFPGAASDLIMQSGGGKIIIGDTSSHTTDLLQIETPASGGGHGIQIRRNDANNDQNIGHILFGNNTATDLVKISAKTDGDSNAGDSGALLFSTQVTSGNLTERMRINSLGDVGIGTTTPDEFTLGTTYRYLAVGGTDKTGIINIIDKTTQGSYLQFGTAAGVRRASIHALDGSHLAFNTNTNNSGTSIPEKMRITNDGKVGIGNNNPVQQLDVVGAIRVNSGADRKIDFLRTGGNHYSIEHDTSQIYFYNHATSEAPLLIQNDGDVIMSAGNVGIGTTSPSEKLEVAGNVKSAGLKFDVNTSMYAQDATLSYYSSTNAVYLNGAGANGWLRLNASGLANDRTAINLFGQNQGDIITFKTATNTVMQINSSGNVGIGTTTPQGKLDVDGDLRITRDIVSNTQYEMLSFGSDRSINDYGGLNKDYWRVGIITPGINTTGGSAAHGYGSLVFSGVTGNNSTYSNKMVIEHTGKVGIGTITPGHKLDVQHTITSGGSEAIANFGTSGSGNWANSAHQVVVGGPSVLSYTGIIVHSDSTAGNGQISFADGRGANDSWRGAVAYAHATDHMHFWTNANERMRIDSTGKVGINWTGSTARLGIIQNGSSTPGMNITDGSSSDFMVYAGYVSGTARIGPSTGHLAIQTQGSERMRIDSAGRVGIGVTSCAQNFVVGTTTNYDPPGLGSSNGNFSILKKDSNDAGDYGLLTGVSSDGNVWQQVQRTDGTATAYHLYLQPSGGNVAIGLQQNYVYVPNPGTSLTVAKHRSGTGNVTSYLTHLSLEAIGYAGSNYQLSCIDFNGGDTAGAHNGYGRIGCSSMNGANNQESASLEFYVKAPGFGLDGTTHAMKICGKVDTSSAGSGTSRNGVLFTYQGIAIDRTWADYPSLSIMNATPYSSNVSTQGELRIHGTNISSASYPGTSGSDFSVTTRSDGGYATGSDRRRKKNITTIENALSTVKQLTGKRFQTVNSTNEVQEHVSKNGYKLGFIAQEVEDIIPETVIYHEDEDDGTDNYNSAYAIDYSSVVALLVNAIKEQDTTIQDLKSRIETLEG